MSLGRAQRETLLVLGYMYLRMGELDRAGRLFATLISLANKREAKEGVGFDSLDRLAHASMAVVHLEHDNPAAALESLHQATQGRVLSSREAALHLLRARALWKQGRADEARQAVTTFTNLGGRFDDARPAKTQHLDQVREIAP